MLQIIAIIGLLELLEPSFLAKTGVRQSVLPKRYGAYQHRGLDEQETIAISFLFWGIIP